MKKQYTAHEIEILEGLEAVRRRPGMYIGSTGPRGLHHLLWELLDNAIDEHLAGYGRKIHVTLHADQSVTVADEGRGIPVDIHPKTGRPAVEAVLTMLHAGGKFGEGGYTISGGLHGVGLAVVNALSRRLDVTIYRDGKIYRQTYERGLPKSDLTIEGDTSKTGTTITFLPDDSIFEDVRWNIDVIISRLKEYAFLNGDLTIHLFDERNEDDKKSWVFSYQGGLVEFVKTLNESYTPIHDEVFYIDEEVDRVRVRVAFQYNDDYNERIFSFANNIKTPDGGYHETGFKTALTRCLNAYGKTSKILKGSMSLTGQDVREGLTAVISVYLENPQFEGQTKGKLGNSFIRSLVENVVFERLSIWLDHHPEAASRIIKKALDAYQAREASKKAREISRKGNSKTTSHGLPGKLADCRSKRPSECEIFLVEGDSAGGTAKQARDRETQAILPLKGKILNVERSGLNKILQNQEISSLIQALGCGIGDEFDIRKLRYHKIVILVDADVDGSHIATLLLAFFYRYMPQLIENGHVYFAQPPLYRVTLGQEKYYLRDDRELEEFKETVGKGKKMIVQRFKGLGEMQAEQLWETTMNPKTRSLLQIDIMSALEADRITSMLMSSDVSARRQLIESHDLSLEMLDI